MARQRAVAETPSVALAPRPASMICPAFAGTAIAGGRRLRIRHADGELAVEGPPAFLRAALDLCDGTRTMDSLLQALPSGVDAGRFAAFVSDLLEAGALVDGNLLTVHALKYAFQGAPQGVSAPPRETDGIGRRPRVLPGGAGLRIESVGEAPWMAALQGRISTYAFSDAALPPGSLAALLWSLCGITQAGHERLGAGVARRTIASAGALHLVQPYVALRREVDGHAVGVYRVHYPGPRQIALERVGDAVRLMRAFVQPWHVQSAAGAVFLAGDVVLAATRYRNRAVQYLFSEAGAALHNGGLAAASLGLGYATLGCYDETVVQALCGMGTQTVLGSAVFGALPQAASAAKVEGGPELEFTWIDTEGVGLPARSTAALCLARARLRRDAPDGEYAWGADPDPEIAYRKASAEAIERLAWNTLGATVRARGAELSDACDPSAHIGYSAAQYRRLDFPFRPYAEERAYHWVRAVALADDAQAWMPADLVHARATLAAAGLAENHPLTYATSSGCAAGASVQDATGRALLELVERDAFMRHWLAQRPGAALAEDSLPADIQARLRRLRDLPCEIGVQALDSGWAHVYLAWVRDDARPFATLGAAAGLDPAEALARAVAELESRVLAWTRGHAPGLRQPSLARTPADHFDLYGLRRYYRRADALFDARATAADFPGLAAGRPMAGALLDRLIAGGVSPLIVDLTTSACVLDHGRRWLHVVKAFAPGLVPLSFGHGLEPLGMVAQAHRRALFPHPFP